MNNPTDVSNTQPADDQAPAGHLLITGEAGAGKTTLAMTLMKGLLNQHADGEHHD
ncbi:MULTISPECIES: ATP-binding protein [Pantoea]|uniref:ATP-binding protein n=1 Tax=Pantoea TaxID=53335 RepID=UPI00118132A5|nr:MULTISPECIES: ATP-binding protein [Pantoea]UIL55070.1 ATP-binding protein [Pantoea agglomerans]